MRLDSFDQENAKKQTSPNKDENPAYGLDRSVDQSSLHKTFESTFSFFHRGDGLVSLIPA